MALPAYVTQKNVRGSDVPENVVLLRQNDAIVTYLIWDDLDVYAKAKFDSISGESNLITALKSINYRGQTFYQYLSDSIVSFDVSSTSFDLYKNDTSGQNPLNSTFDAIENKIRVGKYSGNSELATFTTTNVFSYLSTYGPSRLRDVIETTGTGTVFENEGKIRMSTGTSASSINVTTVESGRYMPGKSAEAGVAAFIITPLQGDQEVTVELGDSRNAARFVITENDTKIEVIRAGLVKTSISQKDWNLNNADGVGDSSDGSNFNYTPFDKGYIYNFNFNWYGVGKIIYSIESAIKKRKEPLTKIPVHEYIPADFANHSFIDPSLPITITVNNGTTGEDVIVDLGGRRYDILGEFTPEVRATTVYHTLDTFTSDRQVAFGVRRKTDFPSADRINHIPIYLKEISSALTGSTGAIRIYSVPRGTLTGTWGDLPEINDPAETGLELNTTIQDITAVPKVDKFLLQGPLVFENAQKNDVTVAQDKGLRVSLIKDEEFVIEVDADATVNGTITIRWSEEF